MEKDIWIAIVAGLPGLILALIAWRKAPSEMDAAADKAQHSATKSIADSARSLVDSLHIEVETLRVELLGAEKRADAAHKLVGELQQRLTNAEARLAQAEARTADAEKRASEFRIELIKVGTILDKSRREYQRQIDELVIVIQSLIKQVGQLGGKPDIDMDLLQRVANLSGGV